jgi:glycosyltransferase involved in cell wall biosynthesis
MAEKNNYSERLKIFIWNPNIEHLQFFTWLALKSLCHNSTFVLGYMESEVRKAQEWKLVDLKELDPIVISPDKLKRDGIKILIENSDAVHVFQAFRGSEGYNYFPLILYALFKGIKVVVYDEAYTISPVGYFHDEHPLLAQFKTWVRPALRYCMAKTLMAISHSHKPCIMPLSLIAKKQFIKAGFPLESLFPFGYFVPRLFNSKRNPMPSDTLHLIFVGALIFRKGLDILVEAIRELNAQGYKVTLDIYGSGDPQKAIWPDLPINYKGTLPFDQIQAVIAEHDLLILPSRHDGWGVVVNEALLQGVPVILSSRVGAKCLVQSTDAGLVFESENSSDLAKKMKALIEDPTLLLKLHNKALEVGEKILPEIAARYFLDTLLFYFYKIGVRPSAIWSNELLEE